MCKGRAVRQAPKNSRANRGASDERSWGGERGCRARGPVSAGGHERGEFYQDGTRVTLTRIVEGGHRPDARRRLGRAFPLPWWRIGRRRSLQERTCREARLF